MMAVATIKSVAYYSLVAVDFAGIFFIFFKLYITHHAL